MVIEFIVAGIFIFLVLLYFKTDKNPHRYKTVVIIIVGLLIYFSVMSIFSSAQVDVSSPRGIVNGVYVYFAWIGNAMGNLWDVGKETVGMVGNAIKINNSEDKPRR